MKSVNWRDTGLVEVVYRVKDADALGYRTLEFTSEAELQAFMDKARPRLMFRQMLCDLDLSDSSDLRAIETLVFERHDEIREILNEAFPVVEAEPAIVLGFIDGDACGVPGCDGVLVDDKVKNCSCHLSAPCNQCVTTTASCPKCRRTVPSI